MLELDFDRMALLHNGVEAAPLFEGWRYGRKDAEALAAAATEAGRKLTEAEAVMALGRR